MRAASFGFPAGEHFFQVSFPRYGNAQSVVAVLLIFCLFFWIIACPVLLRQKRQVREDLGKERQEHNQKGQEAQSKSEQSSSGSKAKNAKKKSKEKAICRSGVKLSNFVSDSNPEPTSTVVLEASIWVSAVTVLGFLVTSLCILIWCSPYNNWLPRRVFETPVLTREECNEIVARAMAAAERNAEQAKARLEAAGGWDHVKSDENQTLLAPLMEYPRGWQKSRHHSYATTDLNLVTDPFTKEDRDYIGSLLDRRLAPLMSHLFGIPEGSIRCNDMFVVRYDADRRAHLANHSDDGDISFNILLNDDFEGGGTKFWDRSKGKPFAHVEPTEPGMGLLHSALIHHEGYPISHGTRIILVGFTSIDRIDPRQNTFWTGLGWLASYASFNFLTVKLKASVHNAERRLAKNQGLVERWDENEYVLYLFRDIHDFLLDIVDRWSTHTVEHLVASEENTNFLQALDDAYHERETDNNNGNTAKRKASWFKGQHIRLNLDGTVESEWQSRKGNSNKFSEL